MYFYYKFNLEFGPKQTAAKKCIILFVARRVLRESPELFA